jgi:putative ABC transport system substrate-binding protein
MLLTLDFPVSAQQPSKAIKIGELVFRGSVGSNLGEGRRLFRRALHDLGYIEGKNIFFETRSSKGKLDRLPGLAEELVRLKVDLLIASSMDEVIALKNATRIIPIVMMSVGSDPVETGLVQSLADPGGNITGVAAFATQLSSKRMELLKEVIPGAARVAVLFDPANQGNLHQVQDILPAAARLLRLTIEPLEVRTAEDFQNVFASLRKQRPEAVFLPGGPLMNANQKRTADFALKERLPSTYERREAVEAGGLMSYGPDRAELYRRAAYMADKILRGAKPAELPVEQPTKFELVINLETAKQIGTKIPPSVLARADRVIR